MHKQFYEITSFSEELFDSQVELLPSVTELFELQMAYLEFKVLEKSDLINQSAYFKSIDGNLTKHFLAYSHKPDAVIENRFAITKAYFENGQFSTGYATHLLFPYRGKFHPQLIKDFNYA